MSRPPEAPERRPRLPDGVSDYGNDYADQILAVLEEQGVAALDLRETLAACGRDWSSLFSAPTTTGPRRPAFSPARPSRRPSPGLRLHDPREIHR